MWSDRTRPRGIWAWLSVRTGSAGLRLPIFSELEQRADSPSGDEVLCLFRVISGSGPLLDFHIIARDIVCLSITGHVSWFLASTMEDWLTFTNSESAPMAITKDHTTPRVPISRY